MSKYKLDGNLDWLAIQHQMVHAVGVELVRTLQCTYEGLQLSDKIALRAMKYTVFSMAVAKAVDYVCRLSPSKLGEVCVFAFDQPYHPEPTTEMFQTPKGRDIKNLPQFTSRTVITDFHEEVRRHVSVHMFNRRTNGISVMRVYATIALLGILCDVILQHKYRQEWLAARDLADQDDLLGIPGCQV